MLPLEESLIKSPDFSMLPVQIQRTTQNLFGPQFSKHEMYTFANAQALHEAMTEQIREGVSVPVLEGLSFSQWLLHASFYGNTTLENLGKVWPSGHIFSLDPKHNPPIHEDCIALTDELIATVNKNAPVNSVFEASRLNFTRSGDLREKDYGESQNMALFGVDAQNPMFYLVDAAAFFYNHAWAKAWVGKSVKSLLATATDWLSKGEGKGQWNNPFAFSQNLQDGKHGVI